MLALINRTQMILIFMNDADFINIGVNQLYPRYQRSILIQKD